MRRKSQYAVAFLSFRLLIWKLYYKTKIFPTSCTCRYSCICNWVETLRGLGLTIPKKSFLIQSQKDQCTTKLQGCERCKMTPGAYPRSASGLAQKVPFGSLSLVSKFLFQLQFLLFIYSAEQVLPCPGASTPPPPATAILSMMLLCVVAAWRWGAGQLPLCDSVHHWVLTLCFCNCLRC